jgi:hypothetical protein
MGSPVDPATDPLAQRCFSPAVGAATAGTTITSGSGAKPTSTSANDRSGTTASPPEHIAVGRLADTVYTKNLGERAKTS